MDVIDIVSVEQTSETNLARERHNMHIPSMCRHEISDIAVLDQKTSLLDLDLVGTHFFNGGKLSESQAAKIIQDSSLILQKEPNLLQIQKSCFIFGDIHGQFYDMVAVLEQFDLKKDTLLFLGDYVDRGYFSTECYLYLLLLKCHYPDNIYILRGNHESEKMTRFFTFRNEVIHKYSENTYNLFVQSFKCLPIAAVVQNSAFCAHGGISPHFNLVSELNRIDRNREIDYEGIFCDIFWSDPHEMYDFNLGLSWEANQKRRCSVQYSYEDVKKFLKTNRLSMIIRAHEVQEKGYNLFKQYKGHHSVVTIFSAPCYCDSYQNKGAFIQFNNKIEKIVQFSAVPHPFILSGYLDGINWSLPFLAEKVIDFAKSIFEELEYAELIEDAEEVAANMGMMRTERETIDEIISDDSIDCCALSTCDMQVDNFEEIKSLDSENEELKKTISEPCATIPLSPSLVNEELEKLEIKKGLNQNVSLERVIEDNNEKVVEKHKNGFLCCFFD